MGIANPGPSPSTLYITGIDSVVGGSRSRYYRACHAAHRVFRCTARQTLKNTDSGQGSGLHRPILMGGLAFNVSGTDYRKVVAVSLRFPEMSVNCIRRKGTSIS